MADFSLIELKQNDELTDVVRKSNSNFKNLGYALKKKLQGAADSSSAEWKQAVADLSKEMNQKVADLTTDLDSTKEELEAAKETMEKMVPPVGSVLFQYALVNPNTMYPGTVWQKYTKFHTIGVGPSMQRIYKNPLDADGNKMNWSSLETSTENENNILFLVGWRRTA